jgi:hypothetical protein
METDALLKKKEAYLNPTAFYIRAAIYFLIWSFWAWRLSSWSRAAGSVEGPQFNLQERADLRPGTLLFFLSASLASVDWVDVVAAATGTRRFSACTASQVGCGPSSRSSPLRCSVSAPMASWPSSVTVEHYHDMGKWMFALTVFWAYVAFSQYMLIWYANLPEETIFFKVRAWILETVSGSPAARPFCGHLPGAPGSREQA